MHRTVATDLAFSNVLIKRKQCKAKLFEYASGIRSRQIRPRHPAETPRVVLCGGLESLRLRRPEEQAGTTSCRRNQTSSSRPADGVRALCT